MKKLGAFIGLFLFLVIPLNTKAATKVNFTCGECVDNGDSCVEKCSISLVGDDTIVDSFKATLELSQGIELINNDSKYDMAFAEGWGWNGGIYGGKSFDFKANPAKSGKDIKVVDFYVKIAKDAVKPCKISLKPEGFDNVEIEVTVEQTTTVNTGASLPILVLIGGVFVAGIIYVIAKKDTKFYKI